MYRFLFQWEQFLDLGKDKKTSEIEEIMMNQKANQCASLVYTVCGVGVGMWVYGCGCGHVCRCGYGWVCGCGCVCVCACM